ncbi:MAG: FeoB-associated Cys-rich membrane protein [Clostridia bacterium]|nr:FeoB-associated Cys-rich membrane protein [Clostridia bacterium]
MFAWIAQNAVTIIAALSVLLIAGFAVFVLVRDKKRGSGGCTGNCATCGMGCSCVEKKK